MAAQTFIAISELHPNLSHPVSLDIQLFHIYLFLQYPFKQNQCVNAMTNGLKLWIFVACFSELVLLTDPLIKISNIVIFIVF